MHTSLELGISAEQAFTKLKQYNKEELSDIVMVPGEDDFTFFQMLWFAVLTLWNILLTGALAALWYVSTNRNENGHAMDMPNLAAMSSVLPLALPYSVGPVKTPTYAPCDAEILEDELSLIGYSAVIAITGTCLYMAYKIISHIQAYRQLLN